MVDENKYPLYYALTQILIENLEQAQKRVSLKAEKFAGEITFQRQFVADTDNAEKFASASSLIEKNKQQLLDVLIVKNKIDILIKRNKKRAEYFLKKCNNIGLKTDNYDKNELAQIQNSESSDSLVLSESDVQGKLYKDILFFFENGNFNFSTKTNFENSLQLSAEDFCELVSIYPEVVATATDEMLLNSNFKLKLLKSIATYVYDNLAQKGMYEINSKLGSILSFKTAIPDGAQCFVYGAKNLFDARICQYLIKKYPEQKNTILNKVKCNPNSELIPSGLLDLSLFEKDETSQENEQSAEDQELDNEINDIIDSLLGDSNG